MKEVHYIMVYCLEKSYTFETLQRNDRQGSGLANPNFLESSNRSVIDLYQTGLEYIPLSQTLVSGMWPCFKSHIFMNPAKTWISCEKR